MNTYKLKIQYNGSSYLGWQVQPVGKTIQGVLTSCLNKIAKTKEAKTLGSGRTDSGVHALGQIVKIEIPLSINPFSLLKALNSNLPDTIRVIECEECSEDFHPIIHAVKKEYIYAFTLKKERSPFLGELLTRYPHEQFNENLLKQACELFVGGHDFCNYFCTGTPTKTTVREIFNCELIKEPQVGFFSQFNDEVFLLKFEGSGFLKQMVRLLVGALWSASAGKVSLQDIENSLKLKQKNKLAAVAPPQGLYLNNVTY